MGSQAAFESEPLNSSSILLNFTDSAPQWLDSYSMLPVTLKDIPIKSWLLRGASARGYFVSATLLIFVPALLLGGHLASASAEAERLRLEEHLREKAREVSALFDREIATVASLLTALAESYALQTGDLEGFYRHASNVTVKLGLQIVLRDAARGQQILNTALLDGAGRIQPTIPQVHEMELEATDVGRVEADSF